MTKTPNLGTGVMEGMEATEAMLQGAEMEETEAMGEMEEMEELQGTR